MKKTNKYLLITGGILCAAGALAFGIGVAAGGRSYVKQADLNKISGDASMDSEKNYAILDKTKIDAFSSVNIDLHNIDLDIKESDDHDFYLSYHLEKNDGNVPVSWQVKDQKLTITETNGYASSSYIHIDINFLQELLGYSNVVENTNKVTLYLPKQTNLDTFSCKMGLGDLNVEGLHAGQTVINGNDGDMNILNSNLKDLELKTDLGDLVMQNTSCTNSQIVMSDGDIKASNITFRGNNKITSSLGDITLGISEENLADLSIQAETKLGDINIKKSDKLGTITRNDDRVILQSGEKNKNALEIQSSDGDITFQ